MSIYEWSHKEHSDSSLEDPCHVIKSTIIIWGKPSINFAELQSVLNKVANLANDRMPFLKELREGRPITVLFLLGRRCWRRGKLQGGILWGLLSLCKTPSGRLVEQLEAGSSPPLP